MNKPILKVGSEGLGCWGSHMIDPLLQRSFPGSTIQHDPTKPYNLVIRGHFLNQERIRPYTCPYITWSCESERVRHLGSHTPLLEINTTHVPQISNNIYIPHLVAEVKKTVRPDSNLLSDKKFCCSFAFSNHISIHENVFHKMRSLEPTCYAFGDSFHTSDNPFELPSSSRDQNAQKFSSFLFNVGMENKVASGYITEKIAHAFNSGSIPIYWGDDATVNDFFNPASFLNVNEYKSPEAAATAAVEIWRDPQKAQRYLDAPIRINNRLQAYEDIYDPNAEDSPWMIPFIHWLRDAFPDHT
jgi:hypothetical protein